ncbi:MAG: ATP-grasp domain-containing protein [Pseudomonadota bacterium]
MILSFNPVIVADENRIVAGREPDDNDAAAIRRADAIILPQGCREALYRLATAHGAPVFPDFSARFAFPGKTGQARLFRHTAVKHPRTLVFERVDQAWSPPMALPFVFKQDWGGEGEAVFLISDRHDYDTALEAAARLEKSGHRGFIVQEFIPSGGRSVRVVVIGTQRIAYWRVAAPDKDDFKASLSAGGTIDWTSDPDRLAAAVSAVDDLCSKTDINLAGMDLLFAEEKADPEPYFLEINYFFGRHGIGGASAFYRLFAEAVTAWLSSKGLTIDHV